TLEAVSGVFNCGDAVEQAIRLAVPALLIMPPAEHEGKFLVPSLHATSLQSAPLAGAGLGWALA
ncbi:MAG: hypothetical protein ACRDIC_09355, partial [bacterium]